jgi:hypothetical protein
MSKKDFTLRIQDLINDVIAMSRIENNLYQIGINIFDCKFDEIYNKTLKNYVALLLHNDSDKIDTFFWFAYEYMPNVLKTGNQMTIETAQMWDKDENPICYNVLTLAEYLYES